LRAKTAPRDLFGAIFPERKVASDEELARRTFFALQEEAGHRPKRSGRQGPTLYEVFDLYCMQEKTIPEVARRLGCSIGTVANRLKLLQGKVGVKAEELRRTAPHFLQYRDDVRQAARNLKRQKS
jgi:DNA-directed RNA polymerase specialized sigma24 family protein